MRFLSFIVLLVVLSPSAHAIDKIKFSGGAPLHTHQPTVIVPLLAEAFRLQGIEFEAIFQPSNRSLASSNSGQTDGELHRIYELHEVTQNRYPNLMRIESKLMTVHLAIFSNKDLRINNFDGLKGLYIAYQAGRKNIQKLLADRYPTKFIIPANTDKQVFRMLMRSRIDVVISESFLGKLIVAQIPEANIIREVYQDKGIPIYAYINKKHEKLGKKIGLTLEKMKKDGTFERIKTSAEATLIVRQ